MRTACHIFTLAPFRGRGQGEGECSAPLFGGRVHRACGSPRFLSQRALQRPLTPTLSPGEGEGGVFVLGAAHV
jgi:hypothetical protein